MMVPAVLHPFDRFAHPKAREALVFGLMWAGILLLAIATEIGGLYLLDALR